MSNIAMFGPSSEVKQLIRFSGDATDSFTGQIDIASQESLRRKLQSIRNENAAFYKSLSLDKFD